MDNTVNLGMSGKNFFELRLIADIYLVEIRSLSAEQLNAIEYYLGRVVESIDNNDLVAMLQES